MKNLREKFIQFTRSSTAMLFMFIIIVIIILAIFFCGFTTSAHSCWEVMDSISLKRMYRKSFSPLIQFSFSFCPSKFSHFNHGGLITVNRRFYTILLYSKGWKRRSHNYKRMGEAGTINTIVFFEVFFLSQVEDDFGMYRIADTGLGQASFDLTPQKPRERITVM